MLKKFDIATIGGAVQDITFYTSEAKVLPNPKKDPTCLKLIGFEYGAKLKIDEANFSFGGGAQNAAVAFSRLGFKVAAIVAIGADGTGDNIIKNLKNNRVNTKFVQIKKDLGTGFSFVLTDRKTSEHVVFSYRGASSQLNVDEAVLKIISSKWVYVTSLSSNWEKNVLDQVLACKEKIGFKAAWNPGKRQIDAGYGKLKKYLKKTDVLILNKDEATELSLNVEKGKIRNFNAAKLVKIIFKVSGSPIVVVTDGKKGAYAYDGQKVYYAPIIDSKRVDTTGVGDAFGSSFVSGLEIYNGDIAKALKLGILNTSSVVSKIGAENGLLYRKDIGGMEQRC